MTTTFRTPAALAAALLLALGASPAALAQSKTSVSASETVTASVVIKSIDKATRHIVITNEAGETSTMAVPEEVRNFDQLKPGDIIKAQYTVAAEYVLSKPNSPLPDDAQAVVTARAPQGAAPAAGAANLIVVTGNVVGVDQAKHTLKLVNRQGGEVYNITVKSADGLKALPQVKVGDTITAYVRESLMLSASQ